MYIGKLIEERPLDMRYFNSSASKEKATEILASITEPRRRQIMQNYIDHAYYEGTGDLQKLMPLCSRETQEYLKIGDGNPEEGLPQSYAELEQYYERLVRSNIYLIHREIDKLVVGEDALLTDGVIHTLYPGAYLQGEMQLPNINPAAVYQLTKRVPVVFLFDEQGLSIGEHIYITASQAQITEVDNDMVPDTFWNNPLTGKFSG